MPVPWVKIVQLMPTILEVSRELLMRSRQRPQAGVPERIDPSAGAAALAPRVAALEENERRQAELVTAMADQLAQLTSAVTALHAQNRRLLVGQVVTAIVAIIAVALALR